MKNLFKNTNFLFFSIASLFVVITSLAIAMEFFYALLLPYVFLIVWLALKSLDKLVFLIIFMVPLSIPLSEYVHEAPINMFIPTEPLLAGLLLLFIILIPTKQLIKKEIIHHPVTISSMILMLWMLITTITSTMPLVSIKFFVMRLWFLVVFYYLMVMIIKNKKDIERFVWLYTVPMVIVIVYALVRHITYGIFDSKIAHWASNPFYKDHTIYGATLAFYVPVLFIFAIKKNPSLLGRIFRISMLFIFIIALMFSYSRAAWISVIGAGIIYIVIRSKINWRYILSVTILAITIITFSWGHIMLKLEQNRNESNTENIQDQVKSVTNIRNDASNLERINRWKSAFRMFNEKPLLGFGPGTYMFKYAPYQMSYEKTIISTNAGDAGNAHSEYFGPLSEQGLFGMITFLALITSVLVVGIKRYYKVTDPALKNYLAGAILGLITYYLHAFLNNFLDTDKVSVPFWGFTAIIVAIDLYEKKFTNDKKEIANKTQNQIK